MKELIEVTKIALKVVVGLLACPLGFLLLLCIAKICWNHGFWPGSIIALISYPLLWVIIFNT